ncbi:MAG: DHH family phosphoesterase, partial [Oscillibacter sp.]|nr:DHH family phosphoesterase [Oscillibacter sp.]
MKSPKLPRLLEPNINRLLEPNMKLYFLILLVFALAAFPVNPALGAVEIAVAAGVYLAFDRGSKHRRTKVLQYIDSVTGTVESASKSNLINSPLPTMVFRPDTGEVIWCNSEFLKMAGQKERMFETKVEDAAPGFAASWLLAGQRECPERVELNGRRFRVFGSLARSRGKGENLLATTYWVDVTEADALWTAYQDSRPVVALLVLDNYEDLVKACGEAKRSAV